MGNEPSQTAHTSGEFRSAWVRFVAALRRLAAEPPSERSLDAFLTFRDAVLDSLEDQGMLTNLEAAWSGLHENKVSPNPAHLLLMEVLAFPVALDLKDAEEKASKEPKHYVRKRLLGIGSTIMDSTREILDNLPPLAKGVLTAAKEVLDIFRD